MLQSQVREHSHKERLFVLILAIQRLFGNTSLCSDSIHTRAVKSWASLMIYVHLTQDQRDELGVVRRQAIGRVALRTYMVLLSDRGFTVSQIAAIHGCGDGAVRTWLHRYEREGVTGLEDEPRSGRPLKDPLAGPIVDAQASQSPPCSGHVQTC
jgi:Winged helix-turn helix